MMIAVRKLFFKGQTELGGVHDIGYTDIARQPLVLFLVGSELFLNYDKIKETNISSS